MDSILKTKIKNIAQEHIVKAIIEFEEHGFLQSYNINTEKNTIILKRNGFSSTTVSISKTCLIISWMGHTLNLLRPSCEEELFQYMCSDDDFCEPEFEESFNILFDYYIKSFKSQFGLG